MQLKSQAPTIVLIEQDEVTLDLYRRELSKSFAVLGFTEITGVLETLADQDVQAVVIEPEIHYGQGWELIHSIHVTFPNRLIPVIVCTTRDTDNRDRGGEVTKHLTKPVLPKTLREKTLETVRKKPKRGKSS